jgi:Ca2+-binding EF-hand superfamily protein
MENCPNIRPATSGMNLAPKESICNPNQAINIPGTIPDDEGNCNPVHRIVGIARFSVSLPRGPQHTKLRELNRKESIDAKAVPVIQDLNNRYDMATLEKWFKEIDVAQQDSITEEDFIVAMRNHKDLQGLLCQIMGIPADFEFATSSDRLSRFMSPDQRRQMELEQQRAEDKRIKDILKEIDEDSSGSIEWDEFVEFFRRAGFLLDH